MKKTFLLASLLVSMLLIPAMANTTDNTPSEQAAGTSYYQLSGTSSEQAATSASFSEQQAANTPSVQRIEKVQKAEPEDNFAQIVFDTLLIDLGKFSVKNPIQKCTFKYTNTGTVPLVIHQALASCGCTVPTYSKNAVKNGERGTIEVSYNGTGKFPGPFTKTITVRTNAKNELVRLVVKGEMTEK